MRRGFYFSTSNNKYFYNDIDGTIKCCNSDKNDGIVYGKEKEYYKCTAGQVENYLKNTGFRQLILMVTQDCNLRCKYCCFSGEYDNQRNHCKKTMPFEIAKKAVYNYHREFIRIKKKNILAKPIIGFYGGEPLLEFELIKKTVDYIKRLFNEDVTLLITTNGTIMNDEIEEFLIDNKINLTVSLNGNKKENDRMRIYRDGRGTFDDIYRNLMEIKSRDNQYYRENVTLSGVYDIGTDLLEIDEFYNDKKELPQTIKNAMVLSYFTDWYNQYSKEEKEKFYNIKGELFNKFEKKILSKQYDKISNIERGIFLQEIINIRNRNEGDVLENFRPTFLKYTSMCVPGFKVAIDPDGKVHCCEKVNLERPLGDVDKWIDYSEVSKIINDYNSLIYKNCSKCPMQRLCNICFTALLDGKGEFTLENIGDCSSEIDYARKKLSMYYEILEKGANFDEIKG